jgi:hypothetical protein
LGSRSGGKARSSRQNEVVFREGDTAGRKGSGRGGGRIRRGGGARRKEGRVEVDSFGHKRTERLVFGYVWVCETLEGSKGGFEILGRSSEGFQLSVWAEIGRGWREFVEGSLATRWM